MTIIKYDRKKNIRIKKKIKKNNSKKNTIYCKRK